MMSDKVQGVKRENRVIVIVTVEQHVEFLRVSMI